MSVYANVGVSIEIITPEFWEQTALSAWLRAVCILTHRARHTLTLIPI